MVSPLLVNQNLSQRKMVEGMIAIGALTSCQKSPVPKGEQRGYQSLHERQLHKHAVTSTTQQHLPLQGNVPMRLLQMNIQCQGKFKLVCSSLGTNYWDGSTGGSDRTFKKLHLDGSRHGTQPAVNRTTSGLRTSFQPNNGQAKVTQGTLTQTPDPLSAPSGLTYQGSPITPLPYLLGFPGDEEDGFGPPSSDSFMAPTQSTSQTLLKGVNPRSTVCVVLMPSSLVTDTHAISM